MSKINMKGATPAKWSSLCEACRWGHVRTGFRDSEMEVICTDVVPNIPVAFKVRECSSYLHKTRPTWEQMKDLAINVAPLGFRVLGFQPETVEQDENVEA